MGVLGQVFKLQSRSAESQASRVGGSFLDFIGFGTEDFKSANQKTALTLSAFYNGVDQLSNDIAKLPKYVLKKDGEKRIRFNDHPVNYLISQRPNNLMNAFDFWKIVRVSKILKGNAFVEIIRNAKSGFPEELIFRDHDDMEVLRYKDRLYYRYKGRVVDSENMLHFKGFSFDGIIGIGVVRFAAMQIGVSLEAQKYNGNIYKDRGLTYGVIESDKPITSPNKQAISEGFTAKLNAKDVHKVPVLDEGLKYKPITITPAEALFLETNRQGVIEICRWLNIAPHKLKDLTNANYSNIYQQSIEHVQDSVMPGVVSDEQEINNKLFSKEEAGIVYTRFNISALLRGDLDMKQKFYTAMVYSGIYTRNEVRALEDMNPLDGLDEPLQPVNMQALSQIAENMKNNNDDKNNPK